MAEDPLQELRYIEHLIGALKLGQAYAMAAFNLCLSRKGCMMWMWVI